MRSEGALGVSPAGETASTDAPQTDVPATGRRFEPRPVPAPPRRYVAFKRGFDMVVALVGMVLAVPLVLLVVLAVRLTSAGPAFYSQVRVGTGGRHFRCWKFRTMVLDADTRLLAVLASSPAMRAEYERTLKLRTDPRVTRIGRFLRRTSLDELPQLWHVLRGQMSVVGPRPLLVDEPPRYGDALPAVLSVRPGLTGLWQVSGRNAVPYDVRVAMQYEQARSKAVSHDIAIVFRTVVQMVRWRSNGAS